jgi:hypothetical protein
MLDQVDEDRWLSYAEAGELLGVSAEAIRVRARRHKWPRRTPNERGALAQVQVPSDVRRADRAPVRSGPAMTPGRPGTDETKSGGHDHLNNAIVQAFDRTVAVLQSQLDRNGQEIDALHRELANLRSAERDAHDEAAGLRAQLDQLQARGLWARLRNKR